MRKKGLDAAPHARSIPDAGAGRMGDAFVFQWANQRLQTVIGQDVSDVCEYLLGIEDEGELREFASGLIGDGVEVNAFIADLRDTRVTAAAGAGGAGAVGSVPGGGGGTKGAKKGSGPGGYMTGGPADKRVNKGGASNLRDLSSQKAREAEEAQARLERNLMAASASRGSKVDLAALAPEEGMTAYLKADDLDAFGIADVKKDAKKKRGGKSSAAGLDSPLGGGVGDENAGPVYQKPKVSRGERAQILQINSDVAFLAPGRHPCKWVGNGTEYKLVGNCLDCGKILCDQEGEGPCLVCGSEQVYLARTNAMLDGTPVNQAIMAKRRRGGGEEGECDAVDRQLQVCVACQNLCITQHKKILGKF